MRDDAQQDQSDDVIDAMRRRRERAGLAARAKKRQANVRDRQRKDEVEDYEALLNSDDQEEQRAPAAAARQPTDASIPRRKPGKPGKRAKFL